MMSSATSFPRVLLKKLPESECRVSKLSAEIIPQSEHGNAGMSPAGSNNVQNLTEEDEQPRSRKRKRVALQKKRKRSKPLSTDENENLSQDITDVLQCSSPNTQCRLSSNSVDSVDNSRVGGSDPASCLETVEKPLYGENIAESVMRVRRSNYRDVRDMMQMYLAEETFGLYGRSSKPPAKEQTDINSDNQEPNTDLPTLSLDSTRISSVKPSPVGAAKTSKKPSSEKTKLHSVEARVDDSVNKYEGDPNTSEVHSVPHKKRGRPRKNAASGDQLDTGRSDQQPSVDDDWELKVGELSLKFVRRRSKDNCELSVERCRSENSVERQSAGRKQQQLLPVGVDEDRESLPVVSVRLRKKSVKDRVIVSPDNTEPLSNNKSDSRMPEPDCSKTVSDSKPARSRGRTRKSRIETGISDVHSNLVQTEGKDVQASKLHNDNLNAEHGKVQNAVCSEDGSIENVLNSVPSQHSKVYKRRGRPRKFQVQPDFSDGDNKVTQLDSERKTSTCDDENSTEKIVNSLPSKRTRNVKRRGRPKKYQIESDVSDDNDKIVQSETEEDRNTTIMNSVADEHSDDVEPSDDELNNETESKDVGISDEAVTTESNSETKSKQILYDDEMTSNHICQSDKLLSSTISKDAVKIAPLSSSNVGSQRALEDLYSPDDIELFADEDCFTTLQSDIDAAVSNWDEEPQNTNRTRANLLDEDKRSESDHHIELFSEHPSLSSPKQKGEVDSCSPEQNTVPRYGKMPTEPVQSKSSEIPVDEWTSLVKPTIKWFTISTPVINYCDGIHVGMRPDLLQGRCSVQVPVSYFDDDQLLGVGHEKLQLWRMSADDIVELKEQVRTEAQHRRSEHIMPAVLSLTEGEIEQNYHEAARVNSDDVQDCTELTENSDDHCDSDSDADFRKQDLVDETETELQLISNDNNSDDDEPLMSVVSDQQNCDHDTNTVDNDDASSSADTVICDNDSLAMARILNNVDSPSAKPDSPVPDSGNLAASGEPSSITVPENEEDSLQTEVGMPVDSDEHVNTLPVSAHDIDKSNSEQHPKLARFEFLNLDEASVVHNKSADKDTPAVRTETQLDQLAVSADLNVGQLTETENKQESDSIGASDNPVDKAGDLQKPSNESTGSSSCEPASTDKVCTEAVSEAPVEEKQTEQPDSLTSCDVADSKKTGCDEPVVKSVEVARKHGRKKKIKADVNSISKDKHSSSELANSKPITENVQEPLKSACSHNNIEKLNCNLKDAVVVMRRCMDIVNTNTDKHMSSIHRDKDKESSKNEADEHMSSIHHDKNADSSKNEELQPVCKETVKPFSGQSSGKSESESRKSSSEKAKQLSSRSHSHHHHHQSSDKKANEHRSHKPGDGSRSHDHHRHSEHSHRKFSGSVHESSSRCLVYLWKSKASKSRSSCTDKNKTSSTTRLDNSSSKNKHYSHATHSSSHKPKSENLSSEKNIKEDQVQRLESTICSAGGSNISTSIQKPHEATVLEESDSSLKRNAIVDKNAILSHKENECQGSQVMKDSDALSTPTVVPSTKTGISSRQVVGENTDDIDCQFSTKPVSPQNHSTMGSEKHAESFKQTEDVSEMVDHGRRLVEESCTQTQHPLVVIPNCDVQMQSLSTETTESKVVSNESVTAEEDIPGHSQQLKEDGKKNAEDVELCDEMVADPQENSENNRQDPQLSLYTENNELATSVTVKTITADSITSVEPSLIHETVVADLKVTEASVNINCQPASPEVEAIMNNEASVMDCGIRSPSPYEISCMNEDDLVSIIPSSPCITYTIEPDSPVVVIKREIPSPTTISKVPNSDDELAEVAIHSLPSRHESPQFPPIISEEPIIATFVPLQEPAVNDLQGPCSPIPQQNSSTDTPEIFSPRRCQAIDIESPDESEDENQLPKSAVIIPLSVEEADKLIRYQSTVSNVNRRRLDKPLIIPLSITDSCSKPIVTAEISKSSGDSNDFQRRQQNKRPSPPFKPLSSEGGAIQPHKSKVTTGNRGPKMIPLDVDTQTPCGGNCPLAVPPDSFAIKLNSQIEVNNGNNPKVIPLDLEDMCDDPGESLNESMDVDNTTVTLEPLKIIPVDMDMCSETALLPSRNSSAVISLESPSTDATSQDQTRLKVIPLDVDESCDHAIMTPLHSPATTNFPNLAESGHSTTVAVDRELKIIPLEVDGPCGDISNPIVIPLESSTTDKVTDLSDQIPRESASEQVKIIPLDVDELWNPRSIPLNTVDDSIVDCRCSDYDNIPSSPTALDVHPAMNQPQFFVSPVVIPLCDDNLDL